MKKFLAILVAFVMCFGLVACSTEEENTNKVIDAKPLVVVITDKGGIGDHSFNDEAMAALEEVADDEDVDIRYLEANSKNDYAEVIQESINEEATVTIAVGSNLKSSIEAAAKNNPDKFFGIIDAQTDLDNVMSMSFADNQSGFLAGYAAAKTTKTGTIGFLGGEKRETVELYRAGYIAGAKAANKDVKVKTRYIGDFYDEEKGHDAAVKMYVKDEADVIMHVAGMSGTGVIKAAKENKFWAVGVDKDQSHLASDNVLCSAVKDMQPGLEEIVKQAKKGKYKTKYTLYTMEDECVYLSDNAGNIKGSLKEQIDELKEAIEDGKLKVPSDVSEATNFVLPEKLQKITEEE